MEQHPVPQQISSYQFRLVGDMTFKQFLYLAAGGLVSLLFYSTKLHPIVKWPLIIIPFAFGAALAFLPFQDRPLSIWIISFFRVIYSPTLFSWVKYDKQPVYFQTENVQTALVSPTQTTPNSMPKPAFFAKLEDTENMFLSKISSLFNNTPTMPTPIPVPTQIQPPVQNPSTTIVNNGGSAPFMINTPTVTERPSQQVINPMQFRPEVKVPETPLVQVPINPNYHPPSKVTVEEIYPQTPAAQVLPYQKPALPYIPPAPTANQSTVAPQYSSAATPPLPATNPNTIVGQVMDVNNKIVEGAILEIKDVSGRPVRALKTNKLGHFIVVTPLVNGTYTLVTEKDGLEFDPIMFETKGELIPSMLIEAKGVLAN